MYIIYLILSLFGITSPYATNENKHGEAHFQTSTQVASDMLENFHTKAESICLTAGNQSCSGGTVIQDQGVNDNSAYGKGVVSVSDGKTQVATFMPYSTAYRFNPEDIKGDVYNRVNSITGKGINTGYYDQRLNQIVMKDGSMQPLPEGMSAYQIYDHMPVLMTSLKGSQAAISRGAPVGSSDTSVMDSLRKGGVDTTMAKNMVSYPNSFTCANGNAGTSVGNAINCDGSTNNVPSTTNNQVGSTSNGVGVGGNGSGGVPDPADPNNAGANDGDDEIDQQNSKTNQTANLAYSNDGTMKMGNPTSNNSSDSDDGDDDGSVTINSGNNVPIAAGTINNCKNIIYPQADSSKNGVNVLGYSYTYDYYMDVAQCNSYIRPSLDNADSNYAIFPYVVNDAAIAKQGWAYKVQDYLYFDWFGSDDEEVGIRNPQSSKWQANSKDCSVSLLADVYNSSAVDLESMAIQSGLSGTSDTLNNMNCGNQGGENGLNLNDFNSDVQDIFSKVDGNQGPYFNQPFQYWGLTWTCYPDSKDIQQNILHYHVTCVPQMIFVPQVNNYTDYNIWKNFVGPNNYPLGGLFSVGHKGSNNLGGQWPQSDDRDNPNDDSDDDAPTYGINSDDGNYYGQAIASYYPFTINSNLQDSSPDGVSNIMYEFSSHQGDSYHSRRRYYRNNWCSANNYANSPDIVPAGDCRNIMNGILVARNRHFYDFTQTLFQAEAKSLNDTHVSSAASSWNGTVITGTAGYPKQDSDGVWRWHIADLQAPSFGTPSGTKIDSSTDVNAIQKGNYFSYSATVPIDGIYGNTVNNVGNVSVPTDVDFGNGNNISPPGTNTQTITTNGYSYSCQLGNYNGYDTVSGQLKYDVNCTLTNVPPSTDNNSSIAKDVKDHGGSMFGYLRVSVAWHNDDDLDLYNTTPKGDIIYFDNKMHILQLDMNCHSDGCKRDSNNPVENDIWTDKSTIQDGTYQVGVRQSSSTLNHPMSTGYGFTTEIIDSKQTTHYYSYTQPMSKGTMIHCFDYTTAGGVITGVTAKDCFESDASGNPLSHNNNSANSNMANYTVNCDWLGVYNMDSNNNGPPECISFESPQGGNDGNTYYYYLPSGSLSSNGAYNQATGQSSASLTSDQFTMGSVPGNGINIGGDPATNRDWANQFNNGQYNNSNFTFNYTPNGISFSAGDKPNSAFVQKPIVASVYGNSGHYYYLSLACSQAPYIYGVYQGILSDSYAWTGGPTYQQSGVANYPIYVGKYTARTAKDVLQASQGKCVPFQVFDADANGYTWTYDGTSTDFPSWVYQGNPTSYCLNGSGDASIGIGVPCRGATSGTTVTTGNLYTPAYNGTCANIKKDGIFDLLQCGFDDKFPITTFDTHYYSMWEYVAVPVSGTPEVSFTPQSNFCSPVVEIDNGQTTNMDLDGIGPMYSGEFILNTTNCSGVIGIESEGRG